MLNDPITEFGAARTGTGTAEWAEHKLNICRGCSHGCLYCYACWFLLHYKKIASREEWRNERLTANAFRSTFPRKSGVVMYPSSHDITPLTLDRSIAILRLALEAGNQVLVVSKPHLECIKALAGELVRYRRQILFRFTIGSVKEDLTKIWEPGAPTPAERLEALSFAYAAGYDTSVSIEPMLGGVGETIQVVEEVTRHVSETIWIGKMRRIRERVDMSTPEIAQAVELVEQQQSDSEILKLVEHLRSNPKIRWKDSIKKVLAKHGQKTQSPQEPLHGCMGMIRRLLSPLGKGGC
jgi:DNA repair photolyase